MEISMVASEGLDKAVLGTALLKGGKEVLVYDADKAERILFDAGYGDDALYPFLVSCGFDELGEDAPVFVFLDEELGGELSEKRRGGLRIVH